MTLLEVWFTLGRNLQKIGTEEKVVLRLELSEELYFQTFREMAEQLYDDPDKVPLIPPDAIELDGKVKMCFRVRKSDGTP